MSKRETEVLEKVVRVIRDYLNPSKIILFGSRSADQAAPQSDFDLAVDLEKPSISELRKLKEAIEMHSGLYSVDVVFLKSVDEDFRNMVFSTGKCVYERENSPSLQ